MCVRVFIYTHFYMLHIIIDEYKIYIQLDYIFN